MDDQQDANVNSLDVDEKTSRRMSLIRTQDTGPELAVRRILHAMGYRYVTRNRDLPGSPDIANRTRGWAVFVNGCYWHHHEGCAKATVPKRNRKFWVDKFQRNKERDARAKHDLHELGIEPIVVWECELTNLEQVARRLDQRLSTFY